MILKLDGSGAPLEQLARSLKREILEGRLAAQSRYSSRMRRLGQVTLSGGTSSRRYNLQYGEPLLRPQLSASWRRKLRGAEESRALPRMYSL